MDKFDYLQRDCYNLNFKSSYDSSRYVCVYVCVRVWYGCVFCVCVVCILCVCVLRVCLSMYAPHTHKIHTINVCCVCAYQCVLVYMLYARARACVVCAVSVSV